MVAKRVVKEEDCVPCAIYKQPRRMLVKVGSGSSGDTFELKGAEWADARRRAAMTQPSGRMPQASEVCGHRCSSSVHIILGTAFPVD